MVVSRLQDLAPVTNDSIRWFTHVTVNEIYDADTIRNVFWHLAGKTDKRDEDFRFYGIDAEELQLGGSKKTTERMKERGYDARDYLFEVLGGDYTTTKRSKYASYRPTTPWTLPEPKRVLIETFKDENLSDKDGKFGRWLVVIWIDGININQRMIDLGLVQENYYDGIHYDWKPQTWFPVRRGSEYTVPRGKETR